MGQLSVRANAAWSLAGNAAYALSQWLLIVVLARMASLEAVGQFALALALTGPLQMAANMRLRLVQATDVAGRHTFRAYLATRALSSGAAVAIACLIAVVSFGGSHLAPLVLVIALAKAVESLQDIALGRFQQQERMDRGAISMILSAVMSVAVFAVTYRATTSLLVASATLIVVRAAVLLTYDLPVSRIDPAAGSGATRRTSWGEVGAIVACAWPLGLVALMDSLTVNVPRYFVGGVSGEQPLGAYAALVQIALAGFIVVNALGQSVMPRLARLLMHDDRTAFRRLLVQYCASTAAIGLAGVGVTVLGGEWLLRLIYGPSFGQYAPVFVLIMIGGALSYLSLALVLVLTAAGRRGVQTGLYFANIVTAAVGCWLLVPEHGLEGAALATMLANAAQLALSCWLLLVLKPWKPARS